MGARCGATVSTVVYMYGGVSTRACRASNRSAACCAVPPPKALRRLCCSTGTPSPSAARHAPVLIDYLRRRLIVVLRKAHRRGPRLCHRRPAKRWIPRTATGTRPLALEGARLAYPCCGARLTCRSFARCLPSARGSRCTVVPHGGRQQRGRPTGSSRDTDAIEQPTPRARTGVPTWPESGPTQVPLATLAALPGQVLQWLRTVLRGPWSMMGRRPRLLLLHLLPRCMAGVCSAAFSSVGEGSQLSSSSAAAS